MDVNKSQPLFLFVTALLDLQISPAGPVLLVLRAEKKCSYFSALTLLFDILKLQCKSLFLTLKIKVKSVTSNLSIICYYFIFHVFFFSNPNELLNSLKAQNEKDSS